MLHIDQCQLRVRYLPWGTNNYRSYSRSDQIGAMELENVNPTLYEKVCERATSANEMDDNEFDPIDSREVFGRFATAS